jgi:hypothetical protein
VDLWIEKDEYFGGIGRSVGHGHGGAGATTTRERHVRPMLEPYVGNDFPVGALEIDAPFHRSQIARPDQWLKLISQVDD